MTTEISTDPLTMLDSRSEQLQCNNKRKLIFKKSKQLCIVSVSEHTVLDDVFAIRRAKMECVMNCHADDPICHYSCRLAKQKQLKI